MFLFLIISLLCLLLQIAYVANLLLFQQMKQKHVKTPVDIRQQGTVSRSDSTSVFVYHMEGFLFQLELRFPQPFCQERGQTMNGLCCCVAFVPSMRLTVYLYWDNRLCIKEDSKIPRTAEQWENFVFIDKTHWGYYCWPKCVSFKHWWLLHVCLPHPQNSIHLCTCIPATKPTEKFRRDE